MNDITWIEFNNILKTQTFANLYKQLRYFIFNNELTLKQKLKLLYKTRIKKEKQKDIVSINTKNKIIDKKTTVTLDVATTITIYSEIFKNNFFRLYTNNRSSQAIKLFTNEIWSHTGYLDEYRYFLQFGNNCLRNEFVFGKKAEYLKLEFSISSDGERTIYFSCGLPYLFTWHISLDHWKLANLLESITGKYASREYGFYICFDKYPAMNFFFHHDPNDDFKNEKWYNWSKYYFLEDILKGNSEVSNKIIHTENKKFIMPAHEGAGYEEKEYNAIVNRTQYITNYSRWKSKTWYRWEVKVEEGVAHPGKGTCDYNCEEDACYSIAFAADDPLISNADEAITEFIKSVDNTRTRYPL